MSADPQTMDASFVIPAPRGQPCTYEAVDSTAVTRPAPRAGSCTRLVTTLAFVALAALDTFEPVKYVAGSWWLVLILVWFMPWPGRPLAAAEPPRINTNTATTLLTVLVLGWLHVRAGTSFLYIAYYFEPINLTGKALALNYVLQNLATGVLVAALLAPPLHRTFGRASTAIAFAVGTPWFVVTSSGTVFDLSRWTDQPLSNTLWLFEATIIPLLLMEACDLLARRSAANGTDRISGSDFPQRLHKLLERCPRWLARSHAQLLLILTLCGIGMRWYVDGLPSLSPAVSSAVLAVTPLCVLLLTAATVHELRRRRLERARMSRWARLRTQIESVVAVLLLAPLWLWILLVDAPLAEYYAKDAMAALPGPAWTVEYDSDRQTLSLSGEYQFGVGAAFVAALDAHPDTRRVELSGPGGLADEGLAIARAIELRDLDTYVRSRCASACTLAFAAGRERTVREGGLLGFHAVSSPIQFFDGDDNDRYEHHFAGRGVDAEFIRRAMSTPPEDLWYPSNEQLLNAGVLTAIN